MTHPAPMPTIEVRHGDSLQLLRAMPPKSVHMVVCSPPYYGLRDYGLPPTTWGDGWVGCLGLELNPEYVTLSQERLKVESQKFNQDGPGSP